MKPITLLFMGGLLFFLGACRLSKNTSVTPQAGRNPAQTTKPSTAKPNPAHVDTIRWSTDPSAKPPIADAGKNKAAAGKPAASGTTYRIALLLPFSSVQNDEETDAPVPDKDLHAVQFYAGAQVALEQFSETANINLEVKVIDSGAEIADVQKLISSGQLDKAQIIVGPFKAGQVQALAMHTLKTRQILVSPSSPVSGLTLGNPNFVQMNPSLRAHCEAITQYVLRKNKTEDIVLVARGKESDRFPYFQNAAQKYGKPGMKELKLPDTGSDLSKIDLKPYFRTGYTTVFILPSWASQDLVMAFFIKLKAQKGNHNVEVYGMPQWKNFENIAPEYFRDLQVHISCVDCMTENNPAILAFETKFYESYGTLPDEYAYRGYNALSMLAQMLQNYGLSFPEYLPSIEAGGLFGNFKFTAIGGMDASPIDYLENTAVQILHFNGFGFVPVYD